MEKWVSDLLRPEHLRHAVRSWTADEVEPRLIGEVENFVYALETPEGGRILRLTHSSHRTADMVASELEWIVWLAEHGIRACRPIPTRSGDWIEVLPVGDTYFVAALFEQAPGRPVGFRDPDPAVWAPDLFHLWGRTLGRIHAASKRYVPSLPSLKRPEWHEDDIVVRSPDYLSPNDPGALEAMDRSLEWLRTLPSDREGYGLIHADLHQGNFHVHDGEIWAFDFDDCAYHWFIQDLAMPIYYSLMTISLEDTAECVRFMRGFFPPLIDGYRTENALDPFWIEQLPGFLSFRDLLLYAFCYKKYDPVVLNEGNSGFFNRLRRNVHEGASYAEFDFTGMAAAR